MDAVITKIIHDYLVLFSMVNAIGNMPIFSDLTNEMDKKTFRKTCRMAVFTAASIVLVFAFFGDFMLRTIFEVSTPSFKIAGGILVFIVAVNGVLGESKRHKALSTDSDHAAIFPLGFPYLAGPGTILTTILLMQSGGSLTTAVSAVLVYLTVIPILHLVPLMAQYIGKLGVLVISRILYILIAAKAVSFIVEGIKISFSMAR